MDQTLTSCPGQHASPGSVKAGPAPCAAMDGSHGHTTRSRSPEQPSRSSFSSCRETVEDMAQTFTSSKVSSYSRQAAPEEEAVPTGQLSSLEVSEARFMRPRTQPDSRLHGFWLPAVAAENFQGWKQIGVKGRQASRSSGDLRALSIVWSSPAAPDKTKDLEHPVPGESRIEQLPAELHDQIIGHLVLDIPPDGLSARNADLMSLMLSSRALHTATLNALYKNITIPHSRIFGKFMSHVLQNEELGTLVRRLDFSHFNPTALFSTASERATTRNLTPERLLQCLKLTPYLREFLAQEYVDDEINEDVLRKLFFGLERLRALDFCGCSSRNFRFAFESLVKLDWPKALSVSRLSLHQCISLPSDAFEIILPRLHNLTHLDVAGTSITDEALMSIPHTARVTHLNLAKCRMLTAEVVIDFLASHPAVRELQYLSLATDARSHELLGEDDVTALLPLLPATLRSLSLKGSSMATPHIDLLRPLTKHLEELALGRRLKIADIDRLFAPDEPCPSDDGQEEDLTEALAWVPHTLRYLDLSDYTPVELGLSGALHSVLLSKQRHSAPLEVIEVSDSMYKLLALSRAIPHAGWTITNFDSRAWLVRKPHEPQAGGGDGEREAQAEVRRRCGSRDSGHRPWKMGANFWGMRKIPVAVQEVGGMYGNYMFKRRL
ncbi:hypothetical protein GGR56DRAFT_613973 [Xylariaceae sp. FL0804]|nr:hypothetical protein GGR56DRAFT_613973 [Xylariaceae sp. FL0804]